jgi:type II secretory pathway component PulK
MIARRSQGREGFALLIAIWAIGVISLLATTMIIASHYRVRATANVVESAKAERLAEAGVALVKASLARRLQGNRTDVGGDQGALAVSEAGSQKPTICSMPFGSIAAVVIEDEGGKVNLNLAPAEMLVALLRGFGASNEAAAILARNIREFSKIDLDQADNESERQLYASTGLEFGPKHSPFDTPLELDQVVGMSRSLFESLLPFVTTHSGQAGVDPSFAAPALIAALNDAPSHIVRDLDRKPQNLAELSSPGQRPSSLSNVVFRSQSLRTSFLINAEVMTGAGGYFSREVVVEWHGESVGLTTQEWRRGRGRFRSLLSQLLENRRVTWPKC